MTKDLFRKEVTDRLSSPEQIDRLLIVVGVRGWISLIVILALTVGILIWAFFGTISITAHGVGIFFNPGNISVIRSSVNGTVDSIYIEGGDRVKVGEKLLTLSNPSLTTHSSELITRIEFLETNLEMEKKQYQDTLQTQLKLNRTLLDLKKLKLKGLEEMIQNRVQDPMLLNQLKANFYDAEIAVQEQESQIALIEQAIAFPNDQELIEKKKWDLISLKEQLNATNEMINALNFCSPVEGTILLINAVVGEEILSGAILLWVESSSKLEENHIYSFFPVDQGELIKVGMQAQIQFASVDPEKYGKMLGKVTRILPYAGTEGSRILKSIPSTQLRDFLTQQKGAIGIEIEPIKDLNTVSKFKWTTKKGPPFVVIPGALTTVNITIGEKRPISYLLPLDIERNSSHD